MYEYSIKTHTYTAMVKVFTTLPFPFHFSPLFSPRPLPPFPSSLQTVTTGMAATTREEIMRICRWACRYA